jgi:excinuclease ABC subunit A
MPAQITIRGARLHNLKNISLNIPKEQLVVLTGLSGSGKSTLGFDILLKEGQRQYMEALGMLPFGVAKAEVEALSGLSPSVSIDQRLANHSPRSTVGTSTEVFTYLRVLFARLGYRPCPSCGQVVPPFHSSSEAGWTEEIEASDGDRSSEETFPCPHCGTALQQLSMAHFSFNKPEGACPTCTGLGSVQQADLKRLVDASKSILDGAVWGWVKPLIDYHGGVLKAAAGYYGFNFDLSQPVNVYTQVQHDLLFYGVESPLFRRHFPKVEPPPTVRGGRFEGVATNLLRRYAEHLHAHVSEAGYRDALEEFIVTQTCPDCAGTRLKAESRAVTVNGQTIIDLAQLPLNDLSAWLDGLSAVLKADEKRISETVLADLHKRIAHLVEAGAGYLSLDRASPSLSAGEAQRLKLGGLLGSGLSGVLYVFDEPTIGLHARDTRRLIALLKRLRDLGNSVLVIEHDLEMIAAADYLIDFGPGGGKHGGQVMAVGTPGEVRAHSGSLTGAYLSGNASIPLPERRRKPGSQAITIHGAKAHNLKDLTVRFPLGVLVAVTGVSGSGKSTLVFDILDRALRKRLYGSGEAVGMHGSIEGLEQVDQVITIDQEHIGRMPRSNAATYAEVFTPIRTAFAATLAARQMELTPRHFSFNLPGGRCERCAGMGVLAVQMHFLPEIEVRCPVCHGRRFNPNILQVHYREHDISEVLDLTIEEALHLFADIPAAHSRLQVLCDVGVGYLQLGQPATTLSGGEAQRVKMAKELGRRSRGHTLYLLDEPTKGLHLADVARLLEVLQRLVAAGSSVIVIEHNLELIKTADWVIDLGPEGGASGGRLVAEGTPEEVALIPESVTGMHLKALG